MRRFINLLAAPYKVSTAVLESVNLAYGSRDASINIYISSVFIVFYLAERKKFASFAKSRKCFLLLAENDFSHYILSPVCKIREPANHTGTVPLDGGRGSFE